MLPLAEAEAQVQAEACECCSPRAGDVSWMRAARAARLLAWASLAWMTLEGAAGLVAGVVAGSVALSGWALSSVVEGLASVIVIWRFTGARAVSPGAEDQAQRAVAVSFWLLAPCVAVEALHHLATGAHARPSPLGIALTACSVLIMPGLGVVKHRLGRRLDSAATAGEGTQNLLCAYLAGAVLFGLAANAAFGWWWADPVLALGVCAVAVHQGRRAWDGDDCC
jgi:divalent metal cation (Fe/Co/Zn/Cd) transporter